MFKRKKEQPEFGAATDIKQPTKKRGRIGMNWKSLLLAFVIVGIGIMLFSTDAGREFAGQAVNFVTAGAGNAISGFFSRVFNWQLPYSQTDMPSGEQFMISISIPKESFYGHKYTVSNTSLSMEGVCDSGIEVGDIVTRTESVECTISAEYMKGEFEYTAAGIVRFDGDLSSLEVNGNSYSSGKTSTDNRLETSFGIMPTVFTLDSIMQKEVTLTSPTGSIEILTPEGSLKSRIELAGEDIKIDGFVGFIKLEGSNINLKGLVVSLKGTGAHSSFSWPA